jgi:hypothetical protein
MPSIDRVLGSHERAHARNSQTGKLSCEQILNSDGQIANSDPSRIVDRVGDCGGTDVGELT